MFEASKIMMESGLFSLNSSHVGFADNLVTVKNKFGINFRAISDVKVVFSESHNFTQWLKGFGIILSEPEYPS